MNVVLVHPQHGAKVAINQTEMENDFKEGWVEYISEEVKILEDVKPTTRKWTRNKLNPVPDFLSVE